MFLIHLVPCLLLIIFNALLLAGVLKAEKKRSSGEEEAGDHAQFLGSEISLNTFSEE